MAGTLEITPPPKRLHGPLLMDNAALFRAGGRCSSVERAFAHGAPSLSYFSFQPVFHDWCNKDRGMCYPVCMHIKKNLLLIGKSSPYGGSGFPLSLSDALNTFCLRLYGVGQMVKDHSASENGNPLPLHWLLFPRDLLYASSYRKDNTYHGLCYTTRGVLTGTKTRSMDPP